MPQIFFDNYLANIPHFGSRFRNGLDKLFLATISKYPYNYYNRDEQLSYLEWYIF